VTRYILDTLQNIQTVSVKSVSESYEHYRMMTPPMTLSDPNYPKSCIFLNFRKLPPMKVTHLVQVFSLEIFRTVVLQLTSFNWH